MTTNPLPARHKADPRRPYKAIAAGLMAAVAVLVAQGQGILPPWLLLLLAALVAGLGTYVIPNPLRRS